MATVNLLVLIVFQIGGSSEVEVNEKKDRVNDALNATRAAVEEGIVPGGGVALVRCATALDAVKSENDDQKLGVELLRRTLQSPIRQIVENAGQEPSLVVDKVLGYDDVNMGFDALNNEYVNMVNAGKGIIVNTKYLNIY